MREWEILINVCWPHERLRIGYEILKPTEDENYNTITIDVLIIGIIIHWT